MDYWLRNKAEKVTPIRNRVWLSIENDSKQNRANRLHIIKKKTLICLHVCMYSYQYSLLVYIYIVYG